MTEERRNANWDIKNAFGNYAVLVFSQIAVAIFSFASVSLATRVLGAEGYGGIVAVIAASSVIQIFVNWTCIGLARFGVEEFVESGKISKAFWARTLIFLPNTLIFFVFSLFWFPLLADWLKLPPEAFWLVVLHFFIMAFWIHLQHAFQGAKLPKLQGSLLAIERILIFLLLVFLFFTGNLTWLSAVWAYILPALSMTLIGLWQIRKIISWKPEFDRETFRKMLNFSIPLIPFSLIGYFSTNYLDAIFISQYLTKTELGIYSVAYQINGILMQFPTLAGSLLMPLFITLQSNNQERLVKNFISDILPLLTFIWGIICVLTAIGGMIFIPLIFGSEVKESSGILWILVISANFAAPCLFGYSPFINAVSATKIGTVMAVVAAFTNLIANFFLIPSLGLRGCAIATVLAYFASFGVAVCLSKWKFSIEIGWVFQATFLCLIVSAVFSFSGNYFFTLLSFIIIFSFLTLIYRKSIFRSFELLKNYRKVFTN